MIFSLALILIFWYFLATKTSINDFAMAILTVYVMISVAVFVKSRISRAKAVHL